MKTLKLAFLLSAVAFIALQVFYYSQMPETVATHFDFAGRANGWMPRLTSLIVSCALVLFVTSTLWFTPLLVQRMGPWAVNIPKKEYWLSPENEPRFRSIMEDFMSTLGLATNLFFVYVFHQVYLYNTGSTGRVSIVGLIVFLGALALIIVRWLWKLYDVPTTAS